MVSTGLNPPDYLYINILRAKTVWQREQREEEKIMADMAIETRAATPSRFRNAGLWALQIAGAAMFFMAGTPKLTGAENMVQVFAAVGLGQWLRYFTGTLEVLGAATLLVPNFAGLAALWLTAVMVAAVIAHLTVLGGNPAIPLALLTAMAIVAWGRRERTARLFRR
jgi:putative oxidoreductase